MFARPAGIGRIELKSEAAISLPESRPEFVSGRFFSCAAHTGRFRRKTVSAGLKLCNTGYHLMGQLLYKTVRGGDSNGNSQTRLCIYGFFKAERDRQQGRQGGACKGDRTRVEQ